MNLPKPPFHSAVEELLYVGIYQKLPDPTYSDGSGHQHVKQAQRDAD